MASGQVWAVATYFKGVEVIGAFTEFVVALPHLDYLLLIND